ncbi:MAG: ATP-dependent metallopeptidase FtsH/Yme1/Tma family protein, partial [Acidimicrobiia bacterium]
MGHKESGGRVTLQAEADGASGAVPFLGLRSPLLGSPQNRAEWSDLGTMSWFARWSRRTRIAVLVAALVGMSASAFVLGRLAAAPDANEVPLSESLRALEDDRVESATLVDRSQRLELELADGSELHSYYADGQGADLSQELLNRGVEVKVEDSGETSAAGSAGAALIVVGLAVGAGLMLRRRAHGLAGFSKGRGRAADVPDTRFSDIAGCDEAIAELREVTQFLHAPERFQLAGARLPKGFLLVGPPGTGKTLLARAVAGEAGVPFFPMSGSDFVETYVGVGASRVRSVFDRARAAGQAIVFIDEIDAVGKARGSGPSNGSSDERENTLNQLLVEMDGFSQSGVIVLAATNRADVLDAALLRPGRFDRQIAVPAPDRAGRTRILALHAAERSLSEDVDFVGLARRTPGLTGADLAFLINEAALEAARSGTETITNDHLDRALSTAMLGRERRSAVITDRDRQITAWHEAGHAVTALVTPGAEDPVQVTVVPRGDAGGVTWMGGTDNRFTTKSEALARLVVALGGRAAEERLLDGDFTQGASGDYQS